MAGEIQFISTAAGVGALGNLISDAEEFVLLITPYVDVSEHLYERLAVACSNVPVRLLCRMSDLDDKHSKRLSELGVVISDSPHLHAKCFANESELLLTSMNLYLHSQSNNWEMGVRVVAPHPVYRDAMKEVERLQRATSAIHKLPAAKRTAPASRRKSATAPKETAAKSAPRKTKRGKTGSCLRCSTEIALKTDQPLCRDCYGKWKLYSNREYQEKYCHACGAKAKTSLAGTPITQGGSRRSVARGRRRGSYRSNRVPVSWMIGGTASAPINSRLNLPQSDTSSSLTTTCLSLRTRGK